MRTIARNNECNPKLEARPKSQVSTSKKFDNDVVKMKPKYSLEPKTSTRLEV